MHWRAGAASSLPPVLHGHREGRQSLSHSQQGEKHAQGAQGGEETCLILWLVKRLFIYSRGRHPLTLGTL